MELLPAWSDDHEIHVVGAKGSIGSDHVSLTFFFARIVYSRLFAGQHDVTISVSAHVGSDSQPLS